MKITRILAYRVELPLREGSYKWSGGKSVTVFDSTIVAIETDQGITGYRRGLPAGSVLPAGLCRGCAGGHRRARAALARRRSDRDRQA